ncbi:winged helix-turn-helix transcriptional regulator [Erythrobacter insulae]|uniref:Winged helix-turn-helix transcriptional regulator n=1 Tax=Erythrobacter insulae TaxID=2584124 RepID=A0A547P9Q2_9SPHN|nr:metalloregulator ArsR/SmtB family transcription factor [Erythrobacter insulae]TRD10882.1 winged helix-turn-helix transcriptional regulator [Erythrobacter insulae]
MTADERLVEELKAIAHPLRFRILRALRGSELNVGEIDDVAAIGQPALSQQLGVLRKAGLVETRKDAKLVYYKLSSDRLTEIGDAIQVLVDQDKASTGYAKRPSPGAANFARLS